MCCLVVRGAIWGLVHCKVSVLFVEDFYINACIALLKSWFSHEFRQIDCSPT